MQRKLFKGILGLLVIIIGRKFATDGIGWRHRLIRRLAGKRIIAVNLRLKDGIIELPRGAGDSLFADCYFEHTPTAREIKQAEKLRRWINEQAALRGLS